MTHDALTVGPSPHIEAPHLTTRRVMADVLIALAPVLAMAVFHFGAPVLKHLALCLTACAAADCWTARLRQRPCPLGDGSALVTGVILALSLPVTAPWHIDVIGGLAAILLGKAVFGGLGQNLFNPAMVGRAFVMIAFSGAMGAGGYIDAASATPILTQATPLSAARDAAGSLPSLWTLLIGSHNGSMGEVSVLAVLLGGAWLVARRAAAWEIPTMGLAGLAVCAVAGQLLGGWLDPAHRVPALHLTVLQHLCSGAFAFGIVFIATDPVTSPITRRGRILFALGLAGLTWLFRALSNYPEGFMFAVLLMNALVPHLNRFCVPRPVGWRPPAPAPAKVEKP